MLKVKPTKSQQRACDAVVGQLKGNYLAVSGFQNLEIQSQDKFTRSLRVLINFKKHTARIWIGTRGQIRDLDGMVLSQNRNGRIMLVKQPPSLSKRTL